VADALARSLAVLALPADALALVGFEEFLEFGRRHVHRVLEILVNLFVIVGHRIALLARRQRSPAAAVARDQPSIPP
jgi:hypothetical protein